MIKNLLKWRLFKGIAITVLVAFVSMIPAQSGYTQTLLPAPGQMVHGTQPFTPTLMKGVRVDVNNPFNLYFLMSDGEKSLSTPQRQDEYEKLIRYFMASLVIPNQDMWVNLSPKEAARIIPDNFAMTEMGRDLLAQDYLLKQFTASLMYPEDELGKQFWQKIYQEAYQRYGTTDIPVDTFNKVWIKADKADIYQKDDTAFLVKSHLKVMLEQDLMAMEGEASSLKGLTLEEAESGPRKMASDVVRNVIIPVIEKEVNEGAHFASVRQAYHAMILATWFKMTLKESLLGQVYADQNKVEGIALNDPQAKDQIYQQYMAAYKTGVFNYIKEEYDTLSRELLPRKYFAGGVVPVESAMLQLNVHPTLARGAMGGNERVLNVLLQPTTGGVIQTPEISSAAETPSANIQAINREDPALSALGNEMQERLAEVTKEIGQAEKAMAQVKAERVTALRKLRDLKKRWLQRFKSMALGGALLLGAASSVMGAPAAPGQVPALPAAPPAVTNAVSVPTAVNTYAIERRQQEIGKTRSAREQVDADTALALERMRLADEGMKELAKKIAQESNYNVQLPEIPVEEQIAWLEEEIAKDRRVLEGDIERVALPVNGGVVIGPPSFATAGASMGSGPYSPSAVFISNYPGKDFVDPVVIGSAIADGFAADSTSFMPMYAGPVALVDWWLKNQAAFESARAYGQSMAVNLQRTPFKKIWSTIIDVVPVSSFDQNGVPVMTNVRRIGVLKNFEVALGRIGRMFGDSKARDLFGSPDEYFTWQDPGKIFVAGPYEKFLRGLAAQYKGDDVIIFNEISRARGVVPEEMFLKADLPNGAAVLNDLIEAGALERVRGGVRLKKDGFGRLIDRSRMPEGERFERIWNLLHPNTQYTLIDEKEYRFKTVGEGSLEDPYYDMEVSGWMLVDNKDGTWTAYSGFYNAYTAMNKKTAERVSGILGVTPDHTIFQPMYSTEAKEMWVDFLRAERMGSGPLGMILDGRNMKPLRPVGDWTELLTTQVGPDGVVRVPSGQSGDPIELTPARRANEFGFWSRMWLLGKDKVVGPLQWWLGDHSVQGQVDQGVTGKGNKYQKRPTADTLPAGWGNWEDKVNYRFHPGKVIRDLEIRIQNANYVGALYRLDGKMPDLIEDEGTPEKTFPAGSWADTFYIINGKAALPENARVRGGMLYVTLSNGQEIPAIQPGTLVKIEGNKIAGIFRANLGMMKKWLAGAPAERERVQRWINALRHQAGFLVDPRSNEENPAVTLVNNMQDVKQFIPLKFVSPGPLNVILRPDGQYDWTGYSQPLSADAMVQVQNGNVTAIFVPSIGAMAAYEAQLSAEVKLFSEGRAQEVQLQNPERLDNFIPTVFIKGEPTEDQRRDWGWRGEKEFVEAVASNRLQMVMVDVEGVLFPEAQIVHEPLPSRPGLSVEMADTMADFTARNDLVIFPREGIMGIQLSRIASLQGTILDPENEAGVWETVSPGNIRINTQSPATEKIFQNGRYVQHEVRKIAGEDFEEVWKVLHQAQFVSRKNIGTNGQNVGPYTDITEILILDENGNLAGRGLPLLGQGFVFKTVQEMPSFLEQNVLVISRDGKRLGFMSVAELKQNTDPVFRADFGEGLIVGLDGKTEQRALPIWKGGFDLVPVDQAEQAMSLASGLKRTILAGALMLGLEASPVRAQSPVEELTGRASAVTNVVSAPVNTRTYVKDNALVIGNQGKGFGFLPKAVLQDPSQTTNLWREVKSIIGIDIQGDYAGQWVRMYGGGYEFWPEGSETEKNATYYQIFSERPEGDTIGPVKVEHATPEQLKNNIGKIKEGAARIERSRQMPNGWPGEMEAVERIATFPGIDPARIRVWHRDDDRRGHVTSFTNRATRLATTLTQNSLTTQEGKRVTFVETRGVHGAIESIAAVRSPENVVQSDFNGIKTESGKTPVFAWLMNNGFFREKEGPQGMPREVEDLPEGEETLWLLQAEYPDQAAEINGVLERVRARNRSADFGAMEAQLFGTQFRNGVPVSGKAIFGPADQDSRPIYRFTTKGTGDSVEYTIDETEVIGYAVTSTKFVIPEQAKASLGLAGRNIKIAEERDSTNTRVLRLFMVDTDTKEEIGTIDSVKHYEKHGDFYVFAVKTDDGNGLVTHFIRATERDGKKELSLEKTISSAANTNGQLFALDSFLADIVPSVLSGKAQGVIQNIAQEAGIPLEKIRLEPSYKSNTENGQNIFYRIHGDPLARPIVYQSVPSAEEALFMVNTEFSGAIPVKSYARTILGEILYEETTPKTLTTGELTTKLELDKVSDLGPHRESLAYTHFDNFYEVHNYILPRGLADESIRDLRETRYIAAGGDPLMLDLIKVNEGGAKVRFMQYDEVGSLDRGRPVTVVCGEVAVIPAEGYVTRVTGWNRNDSRNSLYLYDSLYEHNAEGINTKPNVTFGYYYDLGLEVEHYRDKDYWFFALNGTPLMNQSTTISSWQKAKFWDRDQEEEGRDQSTFVRKFMTRDGVMFRLEQEVNIPGATQKEYLQSTLFADGYPVAIKRGEDVNLSIFQASSKDVWRNGLIGKFFRDVGLGEFILGYTKKVSGDKRAIDVKAIFTEMEGTDNTTDQIIVQRLEEQQIQRIIHEGGQGTLYRNWLTDYVLQPHLLWAVLVVLSGLGISSFKKPWKDKNLNAQRLEGTRILLGKTKPPRKDRPGRFGRPGRGEHAESAMALGLAEKWSVFLATNRSLVVNVFEPTIPTEEILQIPAINDGELTGSVLDPRNKGGIWDAFSPTTVRLKPNSDLRDATSSTLIKDKAVLKQVNDILRRAQGTEGFHNAAVDKMRAFLGAQDGFFNKDEIAALEKKMREGQLSLRTLREDPLTDRDDMSERFDLSVLAGAEQPRSSVLLALRYALEEKWLTEDEMKVLMKEIEMLLPNQLEVAARWSMLFSLVREKVFEKVVQDRTRLDKAFPDPEVRMYRALLAKGYDDLEAYVQNPDNGASAKQRVERYLRDKILEPMADQIRSEIPGLGDSLSEDRKGPFANAVISEFHRFAMLNPAILPDANTRNLVLVDGQEQITFKDSSVFDMPYNPNVVMRYSEPVTFREKVLYHLLLMPPSETNKISIGAIAAIAPMTMFLNRFLIRKLQDAEKLYAADAGKLKNAKKEIVEEFANHLRFWKSVFATNNWSDLFGDRVLGLFKRIAEPDGIQPDLRLKDVFQDEYMYYFFQRLQADEDSSVVQGRARGKGFGMYEELMGKITDNVSLLQERLKKAAELLAPGTAFMAQTEKEKDPVRRETYRNLAKTWRDQVHGLLFQKKGEGEEESRDPLMWSAKERMLAAAIASDSLFWELSTIGNDSAGREPLARFVHDSYTRLMEPVIRQNEQYRLGRNSYAYLVNELTGPMKGVFNLSFFRRFVPKFAMWPVSKWLSGRFMTMKFKRGEFNETVQASALAVMVNNGQPVTGDPLSFLNRSLRNKKLHQSSFVTSAILEEAKKRSGIDPTQRRVNSGQWERFNRRLIEVAFPGASPKTLDFVDSHGKTTYRNQNSLEHYWGIKNRYLRYGIVLARTALTLWAGFTFLAGAPGLAVFMFALGWFGLPLLFGKVKVRAEKAFWLATATLATTNIALFAQVLFGKVTLMTLMSSGVWVTVGLLGLLIPVTIMTAYFVIGFLKGHRAYQDRVWSPYWKHRTTGRWSLTMFRPIKNYRDFVSENFPDWLKNSRVVQGILKLPYFRNNFSGYFYGRILQDLINVQRTRGPILPAGMLVQEKLKDDFRSRAIKNTILGEDEIEALEASVDFIAHYSPGVVKNKEGENWQALLKAARAYEKAVTRIRGTPERDWRGRAYSSMSDEELVRLQRARVLVTPRDPKGQEFMFTNFQAMVLKKPVDDPFAVLQGVTTHEQSHDELMTNVVETYGRLGTHNIAGLREFMPELLEKFQIFLREKNTPEDFIEAKKSMLIVATNLSGYPFSLKAIMDRVKDTKTGPAPFNEEESGWLLRTLADAQDNMRIQETSLLGYCLRTHEEMRENVFRGLLAQAEGQQKYGELINVLRKAEESDDVTALLQQWASVRLNGLEGNARGIELENIQVAIQALNAFLDQVQPNNISVLESIAEDVLNIHLTAANSYADFTYKQQARDVFYEFGSLAKAYARITSMQGDESMEYERKYGRFINNFHFYQKSAKLKTNGMLQYGLLWSSANEFRFARSEVEGVEWEADVSSYQYVSKALENLLKLKDPSLKAYFEKVLAAASADPSSGVKHVKRKDGKGALVFCREMRDVVPIFLAFHKEHYLEILSLENGSADAKLISEVYEMMKYVEKSADAEAIMPVYDKRFDNLVPRNKNGGLNLNAWQNLGRSWNMDAAVRTYPGQSLYRLTYASLVGQSPQAVIINPAFRIWASSNNAFPGARKYKIAQETFTQDLQRAREYLGTFYGKGGILQPAGNAFFDTPGEDSANLIAAVDMYEHVYGTQEDWMTWEWGRPSIHLESVAGFTEPRYTSNVTRYYMDTSLFEVFLNPNTGYDVKLTNESMFNHYLLASLASALLILLPALQGFSGFAFLAPAAIFVPLAFLAMQAVNFHNFHRHWRQEGSISMMLISGMKDVVSAFSYFVHMIPSFIKTRLQAANENFKFATTVKTMIFGSLDRLTRIKTYKQLELVITTNERLQKLWGWAAGAGIVGGATLLGFSAFSAGTLANIIWLGPVLMTAGLLAWGIGTLIKYRQETKAGKPTKAIKFPLEGVIGSLGILGWLVGLFFTTTAGPLITIPYLLASIVILTGSNVYDAHKEEVIENGKVVKLRLSGQNHWAMFTDHPRALMLFLGALAVVVGLTFTPPFAIPIVGYAIHIFLYGTMFWFLRKAFSNVFEAMKFTAQEVNRAQKEVRKEMANRKPKEVAAETTGTPSAPAPQPSSGPTAPLAPASGAVPAPQPVGPVVLSSGTAAASGTAALPAAGQPAKAVLTSDVTSSEVKAEKPAQVEPSKADVKPAEAPKEEDPLDTAIKKAEADVARLREEEAKIKEELADLKREVEEIREELVALRGARAPDITPPSASLIRSPEPVDEVRVAQVTKKEGEHLLRVRQDQQARIEELTAFKSRLDAIERPSETVRQAKRSVSAQLRGLQKRAEHIRRIVGEDPVGGLQALNAEIKKIKDGTVIDKDGTALAQMRRDRAYLMRASRAVTLDDVARVIDAVQAVESKELAGVNKNNVDAVVAVHAGSGDGIRLFAGLNKTQRKEALKIAITSVKANDVIVGAPESEPAKSELLLKLEAVQAAILDPVGGIDFNADSMVITIEMDGNGIPLAARYQDPRILNIPGLKPVVRSIQPLNATNIPALFELVAPGR